jgi:hypothetical protein
MDEWVRFGGGEYAILLLLLLVGRGMDFLSTWVATPNLVLEANPLARKLRWKWGILVNLVLCGLFALWPLPAIIICTTSVLVAARNFQLAWLMRSYGEENYRDWFLERLGDTTPGLFLSCLFAQTGLTAVVGGALMLFSGEWLVPFAIGMGIVAYAVAVTIYTLIALWRHRRGVRLR